MCDQLLGSKGANFPEKTVLSAVKWLGRVQICTVLPMPGLTAALRYKALATVPRMLATSYLFGQSPRSMIFLAAVCCNSGE